MTKTELSIKTLKYTIIKENTKNTKVLFAGGGGGGRSIIRWFSLFAGEFYKLTPAKSSSLVKKHGNEDFKHGINNNNNNNNNIFNFSSFTLSEANYRLTIWLSRYSFFLFYL